MALVAGRCLGCCDCGGDPLADRSSSAVATFLPSYSWDLLLLRPAPFTPTPNMWPSVPVGPSRSALALLAPCCLFLQVVYIQGVTGSSKNKGGKEHPQSKTQSAATFTPEGLPFLLHPSRRWPPPPRPPVGPAGAKRRTPAILLLPGQPNADHGKGSPEISYFLSIYM